MRFSSYFLTLGWSSTLLAQVPFYQGKTIRLVAGTPAGSVYDLYARLVAQFIPKYIPGNPNIIVQNMPGVASMVAANYIYGVAKPDGLTIGSIQPALYFDQLVGRKEVQFEWQKFTWIGNTTVSHHLLYMRSDTPYKTIEDIRKASVPPKCGAEGRLHRPTTFPSSWKRRSGRNSTSLPVITPVLTSTWRWREARCNAAHSPSPPSLPVSLFIPGARRALSASSSKPAKRRDGSLPDVPTLPELMDQYKTSESGRRLATVILAANEIGRPIVATPGIPAERVKILREAFMKSVNDPELLEDAKKKN